MHEKTNLTPSTVTLSISSDARSLHIDTRHPDFPELAPQSMVVPLAEFERHAPSEAARRLGAGVLLMLQATRPDLLSGYPNLRAAIDGPPVPFFPPPATKGA